MRLLDPLPIGSRTARNRVVFGPHETNLGLGRRIAERHVAYYRRRAVGGAGLIVTEEASVHPSDWPYERAPLAAECGEGWARVATACHEAGALVIAAVGHAGGQGSSAYSQAPLWAPSRVPEVNSREVPKWMEPDDIAAVIAGFRAAAAAASAAGLDGVEVNAGQYSLVRQFLSGLTNQRADEWGEDRLRFARAVLEAARGGVGSAGVVGLRLSADELAPWAGIVPDAAAGIAAELSPLVDYITVVRGSIFTVSATRPDGHVAPSFNRDLVTGIRTAVPATLAVIAQGSIVDADDAESLLEICDAVEMTRAQIAEPDLVTKVTDGRAPRPCLLCNQTCQVRDARNPIVTCVVEPTSGYEDVEPEPQPGTGDGPVLVVGAGVAGLECARVAAIRGFDVTVVERGAAVGGAARVAAAGAGRERLDAAWSWLEAECRALGVTIETGREIAAADVAAFDGPVVLCTGGRPGRPTYDIDDPSPVLTAAEVLGGAPVDGPVAVWDPIGGPIGVSVAETLRHQGLAVSLVTTDLIAGNELSRSGDLAPANVRLLGAGIAIEKRSILRRVGPGGAEVEDRFTGERRTLAVATVVDAGYRLPEDRLWHETGERLPRAGDAVAPRTIAEAILEGRRRAMELMAVRHPVGA